MTRPAMEVADAARDRPLARHLAVLCLTLVLPILILAAVLAWTYAAPERGRIEQAAITAAHPAKSAHCR